MSPSFDKFGNGSCRSQPKPLLKGCWAMDGGPNYNCTQCPQKCSYGVHQHIWYHQQKVVDEDATRNLHQTLDRELKDSKKLGNLLNLFNK